MRQTSYDLIRVLRRKHTTLAARFARLEAERDALNARMAPLAETVARTTALLADLDPPPPPVDPADLLALRQAEADEMNRTRPQTLGFVWDVLDMGPELGLMVGPRQATEAEREAAATAAAEGGR